MKNYTFPTILKQTREAVGLSQRDLAKLSGVSRPHISNIELKISGISFDTLTTLMVTLRNEARKRKVEI